MRRREFIGLLSLALIGCPQLTSAQTSPRARRITMLMPYGDGAISDAMRSAFAQALRDLRWIEGQNVRIEYRLGGGDFGRLRSLAKEAVQAKPEVIVALNTPLVAAVLDETRSIPVVFGLVSDPVGSGFVQSYARPGGNATGFAYGGSALASKWLQLLKEISPAISRVAVLLCRACRRSILSSTLRSRCAIICGRTNCRARSQSRGYRAGYRGAGSSARKRSHCDS